MVVTMTGPPLRYIVSQRHAACRDPCLAPLGNGTLREPPRWQYANCACIAASTRSFTTRGGSCAGTPIKVGCNHTRVAQSGFGRSALRAATEWRFSVQTPGGIMHDRVTFEVVCPMLA